jgi:diguanylate cyclase (GGDEF)-like protein
LAHVGSAGVATSPSVWSVGDAVPTETPWRSLPGLEQLLVAPSDPAGFMVTLLDLLITIPGIDAAWIGRPDERGYLLAEAVRAPDMPVLRTAAHMINLQVGARSFGPAARAWTTGIAALSSDVLDDGGLDPWRQDWLRHGFRVGAAIPLSGVCGPHRILNLYSREPEFFLLNWPIPVLTEFGRVIGTAIENRVNHQALLRSNRLLDTLIVGVETLLDPVSEPVVLRGICKRLSETGLFICAAIGWVDKQGVFSYPIAAGKDAANVRRLHQAATQGGAQQLLGLSAWKSGLLQTEEHYSSSSRLAPWREIALRGGWQSAAAAPISRGGAIVSVLFLVSDDTAVVDTETKRLIGQLASNIGRALDELDLKAALRAEREAQSHIARRDKLTDLPNRRAFEETLPLTLARATANGSVVGLGILDLDNFKPINDQYGHGAGDTVLCTLGRRLRAALREVDFVARLGGDEFALIIEDLSSIERIERFFARLGDMISQPITLDHGVEVVVAASLGFTFFPADFESPETLIRHADIALYASKAAKSTRTRFWTTYQEFTGAAPAQSYCRGLLNRQCVEVHYQPVITVRTGAVTAIEALARLRDGDRLVPPAVFLPELNAVDREALFDDVLRQGIVALRQTAPQAPKLALSINVDAEVLSRGRVPALIEAALMHSGIAPSRLIIELLESHEFSNCATAHDQVAAVRQLGVTVAIDDLGVEFSTLTRVQRLHVDHLKIDKVFLADVMNNPKDLAFLASYISLAARLGLTLCIEGVETFDVLDALRILDASLAQGFGIARPMPLDALTNFLAGHVARPIKGPPKTLLGAYALHIRWISVLLFAPNEMALRHYLRRDAKLSLALFLRQAGLDQTALGHAYEALMTLTDQAEPTFATLIAASDRVQALLGEAVIAQRSAATTSIAVEPALQPRQGFAKGPVGQVDHSRASRQRRAAALSLAGQSDGPV